MRPVSAAFLRTLRGPHTDLFRVKVITEFQTGTTPVGTEVDVISGSVSQSSTADIRSSIPGITIDAKWPLSQFDLMAPYGNELFVERGIEFGNGQKEWVGLGYFRINTPQQDLIPDGPVTVTCSDRMAGIIDAEFLKPRQFDETMTRRELVSLLVTEIYPLVTIDWDDAAIADAPIGQTLIVESDRFGTIKDVVTAVGKVAFFNYEGKFKIMTPPDSSGPASWTIDAGHAGVLVEMSRNLTREGVKNVWVCTGQAPDSNTAAYGTAADFGDNSPTRYGGRFGIVPGRYDSPLLITDAMCVTAATELLKKSLGLPYQVNVSSVPNPAVEPNDVIAVAYPDRARSTSLRVEKHVVDEVTIPLGISGGPLQLKTRDQSLILIGEVAT